MLFVSLISRIQDLAISAKLVHCRSIVVLLVDVVSPHVTHTASSYTAIYLKRGRRITYYE